MLSTKKKKSINDGEREIDEQVVRLSAVFRKRREREEGGKEVEEREERTDGLSKLLMSRCMRMHLSQS